MKNCLPALSMVNHVLLLGEAARLLFLPRMVMRKSFGNVLVFHMVNELRGGDYVSKFVPQGKIYARGRVLKIVFENGDHDPMMFFCFIEDVEKLLDGNVKDVLIYLDHPPEA